ncbi:uncharacterized protein [Antedon mediterranea]|uniref:uncharacterized protein n=1 Tax=Antedon mediterranea TaxID=105859 RepID=UPI003AF4E0DF
MYKLVVILLAVLNLQVAWAVFGDDISANNEDNRFQDMGQATLDNFNVDNGNLDLVINVENTATIPEYWLLDFEPYLMNMNRLPIVEATGRLNAKNTGNCSAVFESADFDDYFSDDYFQDQTTAELTVNGKQLYTSFTRGLTLDDNNRRTDVMVASIGMEVFFACENTNAYSIWELTSAAEDDEIEYRTNLYMTNVRPKDVSTATDGIAFVQSHAELIWRISRTAIANVIVSSTAILWPKVDFVRVSAVFDEDGEAIPDKARLKLRFTTVVDSDKQMAVYTEDGVSFLPENIQHQISAVEEHPGTTIGEAPPCDFQYDRQTGTSLQCHQTWDFTILLDIDVPLEDFTNEIPIDASGTFDFVFDLNECDAPVDDVINTATCNIIDRDVKVSTVITIQTTIFIRDEEADSITIMLIALTGVNSDALNVPEAIRGVGHKEVVTMDVKFSPALLRDSFTLELTLFMVCVGEKYTEDKYPHGCLQAPQSERYVAYKDSEFMYANYSSYDLIGDVTQLIDSHEYIQRADGVTLEVPFHRSIFTNLALSGMKSNYTITTVYRLMDKDVTRKKRSIEHKTILTKHLIGENSEITVKDRKRRSLTDDADKEHLKQAGYIAAGCPEKAVHDPVNFDCICPPQYYYNDRRFECTSELNDIIVEAEENPISDNSRPMFSITSILMVISVLLVTVMILK